METLWANEQNCRIVSATAPAEIAAFVAALEEVALDLGWQPGNQIHTHARGALCLTAIVGEDLAGGLQLVHPDTEGHLPCHHVWPELDLNGRTDIVHITILALKPPYRGRSGLFWPLCVEMWRYCAAHRIANISLEVTPDLLRLYRRLGWPLEIVGGLRSHWGEDCFLCQMGVAEVGGAMTIKAIGSYNYREILRLMSRPRSCSSSPELG